MNDGKFFPQQDRQSTWPKITIITPSLNRVEFIAEAIESVIRQEYPNVEHIILDGGSTDGTLDALAKYPHLKVVSEPDQGMYEALNKGLTLATGEWIGFLNTDDFYTAGTFGIVENLFNGNKVEAAAGQTNLFLQKKDGTTSIIRQNKILTEQKLWRELIFANPGFNGWFFKRGVFDQIGHFDSTYRISGDRDFLIRFLLSGLAYVLIDQVLYHYRAHDSSLTLSQTSAHVFEIADENLRTAEQYIKSVPENICRDLMRQRTRTTISVAARYLSTGSYQKALHFMKLGYGYDKFWPIKFALGLFRGAVREIGRRLGFHPSF
jgi:glycosyltransferase involved in cell wall biosynthesis